MRAPLTTLLTLVTLTLGCATGQTGTPSENKIGTVQTDTPVEAKSAKKKTDTIHPDHLALVPSLPASNHVQTEIRQDFNGDGVLDLALVTVPPSSHPMEADGHQRILTMAIRDGEGFRSIQSTECIALCPQCGGIMGDPYQGIEKGKDGQLTVHNYGGSRYRWSVSYTIGWHNDAFHVVGIKRTTFDSLKPNSEEEENLNLLTGVRTSTDKKAAKAHSKSPVRVGTCGGTDPL